MSAYPNFPVKVVGFKFCSALHLARRIEAVQRREGEDADYVVAKCYRCVVTLGTENRLSHTITVPQGFLTDLSTAPCFARPIISRVGPHLEASIVHDWLFVAWQHEGLEPTDEMWRFADYVFRAAMEEANVPRCKRWMMYRASRWFGKDVFYEKECCLFAESQSDRTET